MRQYQQRVPTLEAALIAAHDFLARGTEVSIVPSSDGGYLVRLPSTAAVPDLNAFTAVDITLPSEKALRSPIDTIDEMRTAGTAHYIADTANDGPDHWFGDFTNFAMNFESDRMALS